MVLWHLYLNSSCFRTIFTKMCQVLQIIKYLCGMTGGPWREIYIICTRLLQQPDRSSISISFLRGGHWGTEFWGQAEVWCSNWAPCKLGFQALSTSSGCFSVNYVGPVVFITWHCIGKVLHQSQHRQQPTGGQRLAIWAELKATKTFKNIDSLHVLYPNNFHLFKLAFSKLHGHEETMI